MPFTADMALRPFIGKYRHDVCVSIHPSIQVDAPWYVDVLGAIAEFIAIDVFDALRRANKSQQAFLFQAKAVMTVPDFGDLRRSDSGAPDCAAAGNWSLCIERSSHQLGLVRSAGGRDFWGFRIRDRFLRLQLGDFQRLFYDPTWRIRYVIRRGSDGVEVDDGSAWSGSHLIGKLEATKWRSERSFLARSSDVAD